MTTLATTWLGLSLILCAYAWLGRRSYLALPVAVALAAGAMWVPTGTPRYTAPPAGRYAILGARIDVGQAIYVLLDDGKGVPAYYRLPYSDQKAGELQAALDTASGGGTAAFITDGEEGGETYDGEPPVTGDEPKTPETPEIAS